MRKIILFIGTLLLCTTSVFAQFTYTFTNAGATGETGPTQAQINAAYASTNLNGAVTSTNGIQKWTVPSSGLYSIQALGAQGGGIHGGLGADITGEFFLSGGDVIHILVGQQGLADAASPNGVGGGGGTFVVKAPATSVNDILVIAGGGGGAASTLHPDREGSATNDGNDGLIDGGVANADGQGGTNGNGGNKSVSVCSLDRGAGGGGFLTDGGSICQSAGAADGGDSFLNGGAGGTSSGAGSTGGFGGGGATWSTGYRGSGGGGGYSGGGAGQINANSPNHGGGGGGSYNDGLNPINVAGVNSGHGQVVISVLSSPAPNNAGVNLFVNPERVNNIICGGDTPVDVIIQNFGSNQITSLDIDWTINGVAQSTVSYTQLLDTFGGAGSTVDTVTLGTINITDSTTLVAWTTMPNGVADTVNNNDTASVTLDSIIKINLDLGPDRFSCDGNFVIIENTADTIIYDDYDWSNGSSGSSIVVNQAGTYTVTVTYGPPHCQATDVIQLIPAISPVVNLGPDFESCDNAIIDAQFPGSEYSWSNGDTTQIINVMSSGTYTVSVTTAEGCFGTDDIDVVINPIPVVQLGPDLEICIDDGGATNIGPLNNPNYTYLWSNNKTTNQILVGLPTATPGNKTFWLEVTDDKGCVGSDTIKIRFKTCITGVASVGTTKGWSVYPTPTSDVIYVSTDKELTNSRFSLVNSSGALIKTFESGTIVAEEIISLSTQELPTGIYFLRLDADEFTSTSRVVIQY